MINGAKLMVTVLIDPDQVDEMKAEGMSDQKIAEAIKKAITLTESNMRQPVRDIESVDLVKLF